MEKEKDKIRIRGLRKNSICYKIKKFANWFNWETWIIIQLNRCQRIYASFASIKTIKKAELMKCKNNK